MTIMIISGCSKSNTDPTPSATTVTITGLKVTAIPFIDPGCSCGWDINSGPDVYFKLADGVGNILVTSGIVTDAASVAPLSWTFTPAYTVTNLAATYQLYIYDKDTPPIDPDDLMASGSFTFSQYTSSHPTTIILQNGGGTFVTELTVTWQ